MEKQIPEATAISSHPGSTYFRWVRTDRVTRRQQKREMFLTFMANAKTKKRKQGANYSLLKTFLEFFE